MRVPPTDIPALIAAGRNTDASASVFGRLASSIESSIRPDMLPGLSKDDVFLAIYDARNAVRQLKVQADPAREVLTSVENLLDRNVARMTGRFGLDDGYGTSPDYGELGQVIADLELLEVMNPEIQVRRPVEVRLRNAYIPAEMWAQQHFLSHPVLNLAPIGAAAALTATTEHFLSAEIDKDHDLSKPLNKFPMISAIVVPALSTGFLALDSKGLSGPAGSTIMMITVAGMIRNGILVNSAINAHTARQLEHLENTTDVEFR